jgi:hypothetical protein
MGPAGAVGAPRGMQRNGGNSGEIPRTDRRRATKPATMERVGRGSRVIKRLLRLVGPPDAGGRNRRGKAPEPIEDS